MEKLTVRQRSVTYAFITMLLLVAFSTYCVLVPWETHVRINYAFFAFVFLVIIWLRITGKAKTGTVSNNGTQKAALPPGN